MKKRRKASSSGSRSTNDQTQEHAKAGGEQHPGWWPTKDLAGKTDLESFHVAALWILDRMAALRHCLEVFADHEERARHPAVRDVRACIEALNAREPADDGDPEYRAKKSALSAAVETREYREFLDAMDRLPANGLLALIVGQIRVWGAVASDYGLRIGADEKLAEIVGPHGQEIAGDNWPSAHHAVILLARRALSVVHFVCFGPDFHGDEAGYAESMNRYSEPNAIEEWIGKVTAEEGRIRSLPTVVLSALPPMDLEKRCAGKLANELRALQAREVPVTETVKKPDKLAWLGPALVLLQRRPDMTKKDIAEEVGVDPSRLTRDRTFSKAWKLQRARQSEHIHHALPGKPGELHGIDEDSDLNKPASRQTAEEEEADRWIDREMARKELRRK